VADDADRLRLLEEGADERHRVLVHAQEVGVGDAARQDKGVVVARIRLGHRAIDRERVRLVEMVEGLDLAVVGREQLRRAAGLLDRLPRLRELYLLGALRSDDERDALAIELACHGFLSSLVASFYPCPATGSRQSWVM
jgi:hypothetical protein